jgi:hypothetical protein
VRIGNRHPRQVHGIAHLLISALGRAQELERALDHAHVDLLHHAQRLGVFDELAGQQDAAALVAYARQNLVMHGAQVRHAHHGLAVQDQPIFVQHVAQLVGPLHAVMRASQALCVLIVEHEAIAPAILGLIHGHIGIGQEPGDVAAVEGIERDTDRSREAGDALLLIGRLKAESDEVHRAGLPRLSSRAPRSESGRCTAYSSPPRRNTWPFSSFAASLSTPLTPTIS